MSTIKVDLLKRKTWEQVVSEKAELRKQELMGVHRTQRQLHNTQ